MIGAYSSKRGVSFICCLAVSRGGKNGNIFFHSRKFMAHCNYYLENSQVTVSHKLPKTSKPAVCCVRSGPGGVQNYVTLIPCIYLRNNRLKGGLLLNTSRKKKWQLVCNVFCVFAFVRREFSKVFFGVGKAFLIA